MDRLSRVIATGASTLVLGIVVAATGCRSMRNDVPPSKPFATKGDQSAGSLFKSDPHPNNNLSPIYPNMPNGTPGGMTPGLAGAPAGGQLGTPAPNSGPYMGPSANPYSGGAANQ
jgi:hypothetical protein